MGKKCKYRGFQVQRFGIVDKPLQNSPVADMNPVKCSYGNCSSMLFVVIGNALDCFHVGKIIKRLTFKALKST